jgi:hypothetical protein
MEATGSSETSIDFSHTTRRYIPEDSTLKELKTHLKMFEKNGMVQNIEAIILFRCMRQLN